MKLLVTTVASILIATSSQAADLGASIKVEVAENSATEKFEAKTTLGISIDSAATGAFGGFNFESVDGGNLTLDEYHIGTQVGATTVSFGKQGGVMPEAIAAAGFDTLADANASMTESLQVSAMNVSVALGLADVTADLTDVANVQLAYTLPVATAVVIAGVDYNRSAEEYTYAVQTYADLASGLSVSNTVTYAASTWAFEAGTTTASGITAYLNGDENDALQHVGVSHTRDLNGLSLTGELDYDTDESTLSPTVSLSFAF